MQNVFCTWIACLVPKNQPDQRRSHIGPNAGGSLNLSNWKSKLCIALHNAVKMFHLRGLSNQEHSKFSALEGTFLMSSNVWISGLSPPCTQRNCWFMRAARGRQSKASMHASYTRSVYLILPRGQSVNVCVAYDVEDWLRKKKRKQNFNTFNAKPKVDLHSCLKVKYSVRWRHSWLPLKTFWTISFNEKRLRQIPEQEESGRVAELQSPQVQHTL